MDLFWYLSQTSNITGVSGIAFEAESVARNAERDGKQSERRIVALEQRIERLSLAVMALAEILRDDFHVSEEAIEAKLQAIDIRDGKLDGKLARSAKQCVSCQRANNSNRTACMYCGAQLPTESFLFPES